MAATAPCRSGAASYLACSGCLLAANTARTTDVDLRHTLGTLLTNAPAKVAEMIATAGRIEFVLLRTGGRATEDDPARDQHGQRPEALCRHVETGAGNGPFRHRSN